MVLWREFRRNLQQEDLKEIAENEFEALIQEITEETINKAVEKIQKETTSQVISIKNKMQKEINTLRLQLQYKTEELDNFKLHSIQEVERARTDTFQKCDTRQK